jgi:hypothetical protein
MWIGKTLLPGGECEIAIDELELFNRALDSAEILSIWLAGDLGKCKEVVCTCPCQYDPLCDNIVSDVLDVVATISVAFRNGPAGTDPGCPHERSDVDADGVTTVLDVVKVVNVAFRNQSVAANYVDPCL